jgi:uncharacterized protein YggU (UPF0235/DUF167 family)
MEAAASSPVTPVAGGVRLRLKVQPRARRNRVDGLVTDADGNQALKIAVTAAPESGAANDAVIALLAKELHLAKSALVLCRGAALDHQAHRRSLLAATSEWIRKLEGA